MARFDNAIKLAQKLILKNGQSATLRKVQVGIPSDPTKPWATGLNTNTDTAVVAVFFDQKEKFETPETTRQSTQICYIAAGVLSIPDIDDLIIQNGQSWKIQDIETLAPNGQDILYKLSLG